MIKQFLIMVLLYIENNKLIKQVVNRLEFV